ncbi:uncharacterized protein LOC142522133 [Primulina tabacum]|uniref:uncharacterized protein LOC142522133 n=1 Tax=Primulina tabacum TaxID=48773 RepID=UPI003F59C018
MESHSDDVEEIPIATGSHSQDLSARRAMVSLVEETLNFDFSFLDSGPSHAASSSNLSSGLELATPKTSLRHFLNMNLNALGAMEKATVLSAASILKSSQVKGPLCRIYAEQVRPPISLPALP